MPLKVVLTARAQTTMEEITDFYLSEYSADRTLKIIQSIDEAFNTIANRPYTFPICFDLAKPVNHIRQIIVHNTFKIVYRISKDKIEVLEIFHGNRNPALLLDIESQK